MDRRKCGHRALPSTVRIFITAVAPLYSPDAIVYAQQMYTCSHFRLDHHCMVHLQPQMLGEIFVRHLDKHTLAFRFIARTVVFLSSPGRLERPGPR